MELKEVVLNIVGKRTADNPITQVDLVKTLYRLGYDTTERAVRDLISQMRKDGVLILSQASAGGGYYMSRSMDDYLKFRNTNLLPRVIDMQDTMKLMDYSAKREYNMDAQARLF